MRQRNSSLNNRMRKEVRRPSSSSTLRTVKSWVTSGGVGSTIQRVRISPAVAPTIQPPAMIHAAIKP